MESSYSGGDFPTATFSPITFKQCVTELKRQGLERLLSAVYKREVSINLLLVEGGASKAVLEALRYRNLGSIAESLIEEVKAVVCQNDGGERRYQIIERYYGLDGNMPARLSAMATKHGVSRERIRQIKERSLISLRYKKQAIERLLVELSHRLLSKKAMGLRSTGANCVSDANKIAILPHRQLLFMSDSAINWTEEQSQAILELAWARRALVNGCAGSGKTLLAMMQARRLADAGAKTLLTCFSRSLADRLSDLLGEQENLVVMSFHALCLRMGKLAGITIPGGWNNRAWLEKFPDVLKRAMLMNPKLRFDAIVVDDAQDFRDNWWESIEASLVDRDSAHLFCFADDNVLCNPHQTKLPEVDVESNLTINLRSPAMLSPIISASYVSKKSMRFARSAAAPVEFYRCDSDEETSQTLTHVLCDLVDKGSFLATDVAILTSRLPRYSAAINSRLKGNTRIIRRQSDVPNHALLCRSHSFKGLERKVAILIDLDKRFAALSEDEIKTFVYLTFTRFVDKLVILGSMEAWNRIEALTPATLDQVYMPAKSGWLEKAAELVSADKGFYFP
jgi:hypothetical protein